MSEKEEAVEVSFADGTTELCSALVGADGIFSQVRNLMQLGQVVDGDNSLDKDGKDSLQYLGVMVILGISPLHAEEPEFTHTQTQWVDGCTRVFSMPFGDSKNVMWQLSYPMDEEEAKNLAGKQPELLQEALKRCANWHKPLCDMLERTPAGAVTGHPCYDRDPMDPAQFALHSARKGSLVTLLGDACHPMSPFKGQGANQAILDAQSLAQELSSSSLLHTARRGVSGALRDYEHEMLLRTKSKVLKSRSASSFLHSADALALGNITRAMAAELSSASG